MPPRKKPITISTQLQDAIQASGLTVYALAKLADTSPAQISRYLSGERDIRLETAAKIAAALSLEITTTKPASREGG